MVVRPGAYEPERVQLCAQGLILRANGFQCDRGVLYFIGSKKRVTIEFIDELIQRTRHLRDDFRRTAAAGILPPPLVDSPKCPRCSLVGICLPDETNWLTQRLQTQSTHHCPSDGRLTGESQAVTGTVTDTLSAHHCPSDDCYAEKSQNVTGTVTDTLGTHHCPSDDCQTQNCRASLGQ